MRNHRLMRNRYQIISGIFSRYKVASRRAFDTLKPAAPPDTGPGGAGPGLFPHPSRPVKASPFAASPFFMSICICKELS